MKKTLLSLAFLSITYCAYAQVGVGTDTPQSTLHVVGKPTDTATPDGIIAPNIKRTELIAKNTKYVGEQTGAIVYVYDITGTADAAGGKAVDVTTVGYYYFDGIKWVKLSTPNSQDLRFVGTNNHVTQDAGVGGNGTSLGAGKNNIAIGKSSLNAITVGSGNIAIGENSLSSNLVNNNNVAIGQNASSMYEGAIPSVAIGLNALTKSTGLYNTAVGTSAGEKMTTPFYNTAIGFNSLSNVITDALNTGVGAETGVNLASGNNNTMLGARAGRGLITGSENTFLGSNTATYLKSSAQHFNNTFVGSSITTLTDGSNAANNITYIGTSALGNNTLRSITAASPLTITDGLFLGRNSSVETSLTGTINNATAIGASSVVGASNSIVLGRVPGVPATTTIQDKVGIGTIAPTNILHVKTTDTTVDPVKFEGLRADATATNVVVVDGTGVLKTIPKTSITNGDTTNDAWINNSSSARVELNTLSNGTTARPAGTEIVATDTGRLGIGTTAPTSSLHVVGDAKVTNLPASSSSSVPVYWDNTTGQIQSYPSGKKPFNKVKYSVRLTNSDWVSDLNTNIPTNNYTVIITSAYFKYVSGAPSNYADGVGHTNYSSNNGNPTLNLYPFQSGNTWHLYADYPNASPLTSINGGAAVYQWDFEILVIDNNMVKMIPDQTNTTPQTGSTWSFPIPAGL